MKFQNINRGSYEDIADRGTCNTTYSQNKVVETYEAGSIFSKYKRVKMLEVRNNMLIISMKSSDREIDMECTYR